MNDPFEFFRQCGRRGAEAGRAGLARLTREQRQENGRKGALERERRRQCGTMPQVIRAMFHVIRETGQRFILWEYEDRRGFIHEYPIDRRESAILARIEVQDRERGNTMIIGTYGPGRTEADAMADWKAVSQSQRNITGWRKPE